MAKRSTLRMALMTLNGALGLQLTKSPSVAVCVTGQLRTHKSNMVQQGFANNFHQPRYEYFMMLDDGDQLDAKDTVLHPVRTILYGENISKTVTRPECKPGEETAYHKLMIPMVARHTLCYDAVDAYEKIRGSKYEYVMRVRPDNVFAKPFPHVVDLLSAAQTDVVMFDDHISAARRKWAEMVYLGLFKLQTRCYSTAEHERACEVTKCSKDDPNPTKCSQYEVVALKYSNWVPTLKFYKLFSPTPGCEYPFKQKSVGVKYEEGRVDNKEKHGYRPYFRNDDSDVKIDGSVAM